MFKNLFERAAAKSSLFNMRCDLDALASGFPHAPRSSKALFDLLRNSCLALNNNASEFEVLQVIRQKSARYPDALREILDQFCLMLQASNSGQDAQVNELGGHLEKLFLAATGSPLDPKRSSWMNRLYLTLTRHPAARPTPAEVDSKALGPSPAVMENDISVENVLPAGPHLGQAGSGEPAADESLPASVGQEGAFSEFCEADSASRTQTLLTYKGNADRQVGLPADKAQEFLNAAMALHKEGISTPEELARRMDKLFNKGKRHYSDALWSFFLMLDPSMKRPDSWTDVYAKIDEEELQSLIADIADEAADPRGLRERLSPIPNALVEEAEAMYREHLSSLIRELCEQPNSAGECDFVRNAWQEWRDAQNDGTVPRLKKAVDFVETWCSKLTAELSQRDVTLLWLLTLEETNAVIGKAPPRVPFEDQRSAVAEELLRRLGGLCKRVSLCDYIYKLVVEWERDRGSIGDPESLPTAVELAGVICNAEETYPAYLDADTSPFNIAEVMKQQAIEYFGRFQWDEMEDYINRMPPDEREDLDFQEFVSRFYDTLRGYGTPE